MMYGKLPRDDRGIIVCDGNSTNLLWWNETRQCFQNDTKSESEMGFISSAVNGNSNSSDFLISYVIGTNGVFKYSKNIETGESFVFNITGNLDIKALFTPVIQYDKFINKVYIYDENSGLVVWMNENNIGVWYKNFKKISFLFLIIFWLKIIL